MVVPGTIRRFISIAGALPILFAGPLHAEPFQLPTANHALFEPGHEEAFFVPTPGKTWMSGCFGCVRSEGWQMHEGLDIRCIQRDSHDEPTDPIMATADGTVAYINEKPALSNYGRYIMLRHRIDTVEIYSLYAHLSAVQPGLKKGQTVRAGQMIGTMGRTANTRTPITKDRAHVHFELDLPLNDHFPAWFHARYPKERDDHGVWNGLNMVGLDPRVILLASHEKGDRFNLLDFIRNQTELCRVQVRKTNFPWVKRYAALVRINPVAKKEGVAGYDIAFNFNGVPFQLIPRAASELKGKGRYELLSVNEAEYHKNPCRRLVVQRGGEWKLTNRGLNLLELLTY